MMHHKQLSMFGVKPQSEQAFHIYHDESGTYIPVANANESRQRNGRWLIHGMLFVPADKEAYLVDQLRQVRQQFKFYDEVHYRNLRRAVYGAHTQCARAWLNLYMTQLSEHCRYHALALDTHSEGFQHQRFPQAHIAYNYWAKVTAVGGISWSLQAYKRVALRFFSDRKRRQPEDNFCNYLPREVCRLLAKKRHKHPQQYPQIRLIHYQVESVNSNPTQTPSHKKTASELIQLVDLLTSGIMQALTARSGQRAKIILAETLANWVTDTRRPPWLQTSELHKRFSLSCFPNYKGTFHQPDLLINHRQQMSLFPT